MNEELSNYKNTVLYPFGLRKEKIMKIVLFLAQLVFGWSWTDVSVLGSQVFGQALLKGCDGATMSSIYPI